MEQGRTLMHKLRVRDPLYIIVCVYVACARYVPLLDGAAEIEHIEMTLHTSGKCGMDERADQRLLFKVWIIQNRLL
jgi:hypothetical protein